jgi:hypothetical protein
VVAVRKAKKQALVWLWCVFLIEHADSPTWPVSAPPCIPDLASLIGASGTRDKASGHPHFLHSTTNQAFGLAARGMNLHCKLFLNGTIW